MSYDKLAPSNGKMSISDDDVCSDCKHLAYNPGGLSSCKLVEPGEEWPAIFDSDGYAVSCDKLEVCEPEENWELDPEDICVKCGLHVSQCSDPGNCCD